MLRLLIVLALTFAARPATAQTPSPVPNGLLTSVSELVGTLKDSNLVILHVADRVSAFEEGHLPGARFLRYGDFAVDGADRLGSELPSVEDLRRVFQAAGVSTNSHVVVYGTRTVAAARAFFTLDVMGHPHLAMLDGGLNAWRAAKQLVETGPTKAVRAGDFVPRLNPARLASAQQIQELMPTRAIALVDVRPDAEYLGTDGGMGGMHAAGHIVGAKQLPWNTLVGPDGRFLPREQLAERLAAAGVTPGKPVVSYCMVGMRASVVYFVARLLGHDARLYDGSIVDWTLKKLPVTTTRQ